MERLQLQVLWQTCVTAQYCFVHHMWIHVGGEPVTCHICGKKLRVSVQLNCHVRDVHNGIKRYACDTWNLQIDLPCIHHFWRGFCNKNNFSYQQLPHEGFYSFLSILYQRLLGEAAVEYLSLTAYRRGTYITEYIFHL
jgi:hypothetical protein